VTTSKRRKPFALWLGAALLLALSVLAVVAPIIWGDSAAALSSEVRGGPSAEHLLGTDPLGRDVLDRTLVAARLTLAMAAVTTLIAVGGGIVLGATIVVAGRRVRGLGERLIDLMIAYPPIIVALSITAIFRPSVGSVVVAIGLAFVPQFARLTNTLASSVSSKDYVVVARLVGLRPTRLLFRHVIPNLAGPLLVLTSVGFASAIITLSGLSFIGLGVQEPSYDWGRLLAQALQDLGVNPIEAFGPGIAILITGLAAGLLGDGLNQFLDPRGPVRRRRRRQAATSGGADARTPHAALLAPAPDAVVSVRDLTIAASPESVGAPLVRGVSLDVRAGEILGIVGESGSGKSLTAMAIARLLAPGLHWSAETLSINGADVSDAREQTPVRLATDVGVVFQDPSSCFNPARHVGPQITEVARVHQGLSKRAANELAIERLREARVSSPEVRMRQYPHELSGGMRQRAMIAMALLTSPSLLIADEPTTALDVTVQADVLQLLHRISTTRNMAIVLISHDIKVVSTLCHRVCVMYAGRIVEELTVEDLREGRVCHPYTRALLDAAPRLEPSARQVPLIPLPGRPPQPDQPIVGCAFADRCPLVTDRCRQEDPALRALPRGGVAACHVSTGPLEDLLVTQ
jgi:peptide/nickel transport system permease protein